MRTPANFLLEMDSVHVGVFALQSLRHGFSLSDGDISLEEFYKKVNQKVAKDCYDFYIMQDRGEILLPSIKIFVP